MIGIRSGGATPGLSWRNSWDRRGDLLGELATALFSRRHDAVAGDESILNDCGQAITTIDIQLSEFGGAATDPAWGTFL